MNKGLSRHLVGIGILALLLALAIPAIAENAREECEARAVDSTSAEATAVLGLGIFQALAAPTVQESRRNGRTVKESSQPFVVRDKDGWAVGTGTLTCEATCTGGCGVTGCDPDDGNCTACSCIDNWDCSACTCKKTTTAQTLPRGPVSPGPISPGPISPRF
ncbi:MAG: hypothetical protein AAF604_06920 [Acidobacteriota bacterium]